MRTVLESVHAGRWSAASSSAWTESRYQIHREFYARVVRPRAATTMA